MTKRRHHRGPKTRSAVLKERPMEMGVDAIRAPPMPLGWNGRTSSSPRAAAGRSPTPTLSSADGLTGIPFTNVYNGVPPRHRLRGRRRRDPSGIYDIGIAIGIWTNIRGCVHRRPRGPRRDRYGGWRERPVPDHPVLRDEGQPLHHEHGISTGTLAKVAAKNYRNGVLNPNAFRRTPMDGQAILTRRCSTIR